MTAEHAYVNVHGYILKFHEVWVFLKKTFFPIDLDMVLGTRNVETNEI